MDWTGKVLIVESSALSEQYRKPEHQLWRATGGFGCNPNALGRAVFATSLADGEKVRWSRSEFLGVATDEVVERYTKKEGSEQT